MTPIYICLWPCSIWRLRPVSGATRAVNPIRVSRHWCIVWHGRDRKVASCVSAHVTSLANCLCISRESMNRPWVPTRTCTTRAIVWPQHRWVSMVPLAHSPEPDQYTRSDTRKRTKQMWSATWRINYYIAAFAPPFIASGSVYFAMGTRITPALVRWPNLQNSHIHDGGDGCAQRTCSDSVAIINIVHAICLAMSMWRLYVVLL